MTRKLFLLLLIFFICASIYSEEKEPFKKNNVYVVSGTALSNYGILNAFIIGAGYEGFITRVISWQILLDVWIGGDILIDTEIGFFLHKKVSIFDLYIGATFANGIFLKDSLRIIDIPVYIGSNIFVNDFFGIKVQGKLYALSLVSMILFEVNIGFVLYF